MNPNRIPLRTILIVDDDPLLCRQMVRALCEYHAVVACESAEAARQKLARAHFDLIISDWNMPGESGTSLLAFVAKTYPATRRVLMSGVLDPVMPLEQGDTMLFKPCSSAEIVSAVATILSGREPESALLDRHPFDTH